MITRINESKALTKHIWRKCKFDGQKCNSNQKQNNNKCWCECKLKKKHPCEKDYICNLSTRTFEYGKYLESITNDSVATWDEIIDAARSQPVTFNDKKAASNIDYFYSLLFFSITNITIDKRSYLLLLLPYKTSFKTKIDIIILP